MHHWCLLNRQYLLWELDLFRTGGTELGAWDGICGHPAWYTGQKRGCANFVIMLKVTSQTAGLKDQVMSSLCFCASFFLVFQPVQFASCNDLLLRILLWSEIPQCPVWGRGAPQENLYWELLVFPSRNCPEERGINEDAEPVAATDRNGDS